MATAHFSPRRSGYLLVAAAALAGLCAASADQADDEAAEELDSTKKGSNFRGQFEHHPPDALKKKYILRQRTGFRFRLPPVAKGVGWTGMYSYPALVGEFEVSAAYEWLRAGEPQTGNGLACGIGVAISDAGPSVSLARAFLPGKGKGQGYAVAVVRPGENGKVFEPRRFFPSTARKGKLILRREHKELVCLVAEKLTDRPRELCRVPFPDETARRVLIFADQGGAATEMDARVSQIRMRAGEITNDPKPNPGSGGLWWWLCGAALLGGGTLAFVVIRRKRRAASDDA